MRRVPAWCPITPKAARPLCGAASGDAAMGRRVMRSATLDPKRRLRARSARRKAPRPREGEQAAGDGGAPLGGVRGQVEVAQRPVRVAPHPFGGERHPALDGVEHVVEVVRDAASEPAQGLHLRRRASRASLSHSAAVRSATSRSSSADRRARSSVPFPCATRRGYRGRGSRRATWRSRRRGRPGTLPGCRRPGRWTGLAGARAGRARACFPRPPATGGG